MLLKKMSLAAAIGLGLAAAGGQAADDEAALDLQIEDKSSAPAKSATPAQSGRLSVELALGVLQHRGRGETVDTHRSAVDFRQTWALAPGWRLGLSNRLDQQRTIDDDDQATVNSLREAYVSWQQQADAPWAVDVGRLQLRNGPAFGFNPTDFFRRGSLRTLTTADPIALRENRLGTVLVRAQKLWADASLSVAVAPKLASTPSDGSFSLDLGSTNAQHRVLATWSQRLNERVSGQLLWLGERGASPQFGASATALFGDAVVGFAEWAGGRRPALLDELAGANSPERWRNQLATGATVTLPAQWAVTLELDYNGAGPRQADWMAVAATSPAVLGQYIGAAAFAQDSASRSAWMLYATKKALFVSNLDFTGLVRQNRDDNSWFAWIELRHHWRNADLALQWQRAHGGQISEYGLIPNKQSLQLVGTWFF